MANNEFQSEGFFRDRYIVYKHELKQAVFGLVKRVRGQAPVAQPFASRISTRHAKQLVLREKLAVTSGAPSWFYTAFERGDADPLTNYAMDFIDANASRDARILVTGCGTGITAFHLADRGFSDVTGFDLLPEAIAVATRVREQWSYTQTQFFVDDGFRPTKLQGTFDVITAMHWVFSAWAGNYGNTAQPIERAKDPAVREELLRELIAQYVPHLSPKGLFIIELTDAVTDYRLPSDHRLGAASTTIYPVRHTPDQVARVAREHGLTVRDRKLCVSYGHHPRTSYVLEKAV